MAKCVLHPGRDSVATICAKNYCAICQKGIIAARAAVSKHVDPKECFIWYVANDKWQPIAGTGCAHWVAHERNIKKGSAGDCCLAGFTYRVGKLVEGRTLIANASKAGADLSKVKVNDIWTSLKADHTGLVIRITPPATAGGQPTIIIRHDSSGQGRVAENPFVPYFHGRGKFYR